VTSALISICDEASLTLVTSGSTTDVPGTALCSVILAFETGGIDDWWSGGAETSDIDGSEVENCVLTGIGA